MDTLRDKNQLEELWARRATRRGRCGDRRRAFWRGQRVLVTGHTGFKGSWLALWLHALGARRAPALRSRPRPSPSLFELARRRATVRSAHAATCAIARRVRARVRGSAAGDRAPPRGAAAGAPLLSRPGRDLRDQRHGHGATCSRRCAALRDVRAVVVVTTDKCYENRESARRLPRGRAAGRPRSLQQQQGRRRSSSPPRTGDSFFGGRAAPRSHRRAPAT